jgi:predicted nucleotidyltransferase
MVSMKGAPMSPDVVRHRTELEQVCRAFHVRRLELFGSAATGHDRPGESDLDFLVEFEPLSPGAYANVYFGLLEALEALFERPIDLIAPESITNPYFRQAVDESKVLVFAA